MYDGNNWIIGRRFLKKYYVVFNQAEAAGAANQVGIAKQNLSYTYITYKTNWSALIKTSFVLLGISLCMAVLFSIYLVYRLQKQK